MMHCKTSDSKLNIHIQIEDDILLADLTSQLSDMKLFLIFPTVSNLLFYHNTVASIKRTLQVVLGYLSAYSNYSS